MGGFFLHIRVFAERVNGMTMTPPMILGAIIGLGIVYLLLQYKRKNDIRLWMRELHARAVRAEKDGEFRRAELQDAEKLMAQYTPPEPPLPLTHRQEMILQLLPKFLFINGLGAVVLMWLGLFEPAPAGQFNYVFLIGSVLMGIVCVAIIATANLRRHHGWIQQLNRKYLMLKAEGDFNAMMPALDKILQYYPNVAQLWLEKADQLYRAEKVDDALAAIVKTRELAPNALDIAVIHSLWLMRAGKLNEAERILKTMDDMPKAATDPRVELYRAQLALLRNEQTKAKKYAEKASQLDAGFCTTFLERDDSLAALRDMMKEMKLIF